jgi:hypothetical protein
MRWNPFDFVEPAIGRTKELLFPVNLKYWMKLGFVSLLSGKQTFGGNFSGFGNGVGSASNKSPRNVTANAIPEFKRDAGIIGLVAMLIGFLVLIWTFISSVFNFIFIDALLKKDYSIRKSWGEHKLKGFSLFGFKILFSIIVLLVVAIIFLPFISALLTQGVSEFFENNALSTILLYLLPSLILFFIWMILVGVFFMFVMNFSVIDVHINNVGIFQAIKKTMSNLRNAKTEGFVYFLSIILFGIVLSFAYSLAIVIAGVAFLISFGLIGLLLYLLILVLFSEIVAIIVAIIYAIPVVLILIYVVEVLILPFNVFIRYFSIFNYEQLYNEKVISKTGLNIKKTGLKNKK